jgi:hypothetical protein
MTADHPAACTCHIDEDGIATVCAEHETAAQHMEYRYGKLLDAELDERIREFAGRSPVRIERKAGAVGDFAIARRP